MDDRSSRYAKPDPYCDSNRHGYSYSNGCGNCNRNSHGYSYCDCNGNADIYSAAQSYTKAESGAKGAPESRAQAVIPSNL